MRHLQHLLQFQEKPPTEKIIFLMVVDTVLVKALDKAIEFSCLILDSDLERRRYL